MTDRIKKIIECIVNRECRSDLKWKAGFSDRQLQMFIKRHSKEIAFELLKNTKEKK